MFIKVSKTKSMFIHGTICIRLQPNSWYNYSYLAEYSQPLFGTALPSSDINSYLHHWYDSSDHMLIQEVWFTQLASNKT